jgi:hypothetical protein
MTCRVGIGLTAKSGGNLAQPFPSVKKDALVKKVIVPLPFTLRTYPAGAYPTGHTLQGTSKQSKGMDRVGMGEKGCNNNINPTPYPMRA